MLNERIKSLRKAHGLNQVELARALGVTKQSISNWENDNILPSIEMLMKISRYFSVSADYLLGLDERRCIDASKLSDQQIYHIQQLVNDLQKSNA